MNSSSPKTTAVPLLERFTQAMHHGTAHAQPNTAFNAGIHPVSAYNVPGLPAGPHQYGRWSNPTWSALEETLAQLEGAETIILPSGMAAISAVLYSLVKPGDRILLPSDGYFATRAFTDTFIKPNGVKVFTHATRDLAQADFKDLSLVWIETPSNPTLDICDIAQVVSKVRAHAAPGALIVVDNTTMTPLGQRPLELGADILVNADTKAVNGHSDVVFGHVSSANTQVMQALHAWRKLAGCIPGQFEAWLVHRGLETLELRFDRMCSSAHIIAQRLQAHEKVRQVRYPGLESHPDHALAKRQLLRFGTMIALEMDTLEQAEHFINANPFIRSQTSFGGLHTSAERRARWADPVAPGFIRLSIGIEPVEVLWQSMQQALASA
jgi:cystathionine gamma-lyase